MSVQSGIVSLLDTTLYRTIVAGYSRVGYQLRHLLWADDPQPGSMAGKTALVTGANRGIGKAIAAGLARLGATVLLTVRDREGGELACKEILEAHPEAD